MTAFNKLPGFTPIPPGLERLVLRRLPDGLLLGTLLIGLPALLARLFPWTGREADVTVRIMTIDIYAIAVVVLHWTIVFTIAIAAFIVMVMKGPAYVADAYPLEDAEEPDGAGRVRRS
ncbi:MAG: hypothetical protein IPH26_19550 [Sterolibacteriaceae bacterium]|uniref:Uncharacterized protein n=1 Tax=Candidatus Methylophosphatis roskildensis TaxID=2899263 RepID=A0A9D7E211_9PROT|nr:hypothetical protein [Candidatus Methylophosphatis roskildensis]MBK7237296.1 hypothetical protein [Sterolibacteriaceae bacterium]